MKNSIKREQSQAGLSFAERKNFRPKVKQLRLLSLLALLMTAATGAWATDGNVVYERTLTSWASTDVNNGAGTWIANSATADTEKGLYVTGQGNRQATLTFSHTENSLQTIDLVFNNAGNTGDNGNYSYVDIGNAIRIRSNQQAQNGHVIINGVETAISHCNVKDINRGGDLWTIHIEIDTKENKLTALTLSGNVGGANAASFTLAEETSLGTSATYNTVTLGTNRAKYSISAGIQSIIITEAAPTGYSVSMKDGTQDADKWTVKVGEGQAQALPIGGLKEGDAVTLTYSGRLKVKGVKATSDAAPAVTYTMASEATAADYGKVVCDKGHLHDAKTAVPTGCTAVAVFAYMDGGNNRYGIALQNTASKAKWNTITNNGANKNVLCNVPGTWTVTAPTDASWFVATKAIYEAMFINLGSTTSDSDGTTYDGNVNAFITTGVGGTALDNYYWSTTEKNSTDGWCFSSTYWDYYGKSDQDWKVRPVLVW